MAIDDGLAVHYTAVEKGTPVYDSAESEVGKVAEILDNYREHIFDGVVVELPDGSRHFVDAPEVARTAERARSRSPRRRSAHCRPRTGARAGQDSSRACSAAEPARPFRQNRVTPRERDQERAAWPRRHSARTAVG